MDDTIIILVIGLIVIAAAIGFVYAMVNGLIPGIEFPSAPVVPQAAPPATNSELQGDNSTVDDEGTVEEAPPITSNGDESDEEEEETPKVTDPAAEKQKEIEKETKPPALAQPPAPITIPVDERPTAAVMKPADYFIDTKTFVLKPAFRQKHKITARNTRNSRLVCLRQAPGEWRTSALQAYYCDDHFLNYWYITPQDGGKYRIQIGETMSGVQHCLQAGSSHNDGFLKSTTAPCKAFENQLWSLEADKNDPTAVRIRGDDNKCFRYISTNPDHSLFQLFPCDGHSSELWRITT